jgi:hypothetical protein
MQCPRHALQSVKHMQLLLAACLSAVFPRCFANCSAAALAQRMQLPQTACLALSGPLVVPETGGGRAWFTAFDDKWELIQVHMGLLCVDPC